MVVTRTGLKFVFPVACRDGACVSYLDAATELSKLIVVQVWPAEVEMVSG